MSEPAIGARPSPEDDLKLVAAALARLSEHFDSVAIFTTKQNGSDTQRIHRFSGNWFANFGQIRSWVVAAEKEARWERLKELESEE